MPTTLRPLSARELPTSSPPTPIPRTMTSTGSIMRQACRKSCRIDRIGDRLVEAQRLPFRPGASGIGFAQAFATGSAFLKTEEPTKPGTGRRLLGDCRGGQPCGPDGIPFSSGDDWKVVEL